jgi:Do/DeqQ family serine protease
VRSDGVIVTNNHVIAGADKVNVVLSDRREFDAELILADERSDLAVLRIDTKGEVLPVLEFAESDGLEVGDIVLAIGNPFGVGQTVTSGIISALARTSTGVTDYQFFIQTDASINPGNSGGALVDMSGQLVGVNSAIYSRSGGSNGIGFAIPVSMVRAVVSGALGEGRVVRPWLGAGGQTVTGDIAEGLGLDRPNGVLINNIHPGGPADQAGFKVGDVILQVEDQDVIDPKGMQFRIATLQVGSRAKINIWRDGKITTLRLPLVAPPEVPARNVQTLSGKIPLAGATVANLSPALAYELSMSFGQQGVVVMSVEQRSTAARMRLMPKDIVLSVNGDNVKEVEHLKELLERADGSWEIAVRRGTQVISVRVNE